MTGTDPHDRMERGAETPAAGPGLASPGDSARGFVAHHRAVASPHHGRVQDMDISVRSGRSMASAASSKVRAGGRRGGGAGRCAGFGPAQRAMGPARRRRCEIRL